MSTTRSTCYGSTTYQSLIALSVILLTMVAIWLLLVTQPETKADLEQLPPLSVIVQKVVTQELQPYEQVTGRLHPRRIATLRFEVDGQVVRKHVEPGTHVNAGAELVALNASDYQDRVSQARVQLNIQKLDAVRDQQLLDLAVENVHIQQREVERLVKLSSDNLISLSQLDRARQTLLEMRAEVARLQRQTKTASAREEIKQLELSEATRELDRAVLKAPYDGVVNEMLVEVGDYVVVNQAGVTVIDVSALDLILNVRQDLATYLKLGQDLQLTVLDKNYSGSVIALQTNPDSSTHTYQVKIRISEPSILAGTLATARLPTGERKQYIQVPATAVLNRNGNNYVFTYGDGQVTEVAVQLGQRVGHFFTVVEGLSSHDHIVVKDVVSLQDGQPVRVLE